jgi:ATP dependent DNA ligase domain
VLVLVLCPHVPAQIKLDGERMMCHKDGDTVRFFTRKAIDYTPNYGEVMGPIINSQVSAKRLGTKVCCVALSGAGAKAGERSGGSGVPLLRTGRSSIIEH